VKYGLAVIRGHSLPKIKADEIANLKAVIAEMEAGEAT
jgi:hypothetical protein